jgi:ATP-binding cassette subfamily B protein
MNITAIMNAATLGRPERLRSMIIWTIIEYAFRGAPYGILLLVVWELFKPLQHPGTPLDVNKLILICILLFISLILLFMISRKSYFEMFYGSYEICADGRLTIGEHLRKLSMGFFNSRDPGDIGAYLLSDYANVEHLLSHLLPQIFGAMAMPLVLLVSLAFMDLRMALAAALVIPLALPMVWVSRKIIAYFGKKHQKTRVQAAARMIEYLQGIRVIKAFNLRGAKFDRLEKTFRNLKSISIKIEAGGGPIMILSGFILHGGLTIIILLGLTLLLSESLSLPVYLMFLILGQRVYEPLMQALMFAGELSYYGLGAQRIEDLRKTPILSGGNSAHEPERFDIEFKNATFRYHNQDVLKNITLTIPERSLTAFVGPSGSGKTTMTRLIARFWDVNGGAVHVGGHDIKTYDPDDLLASISMVFQDVYLFNDTIINNIRVGKKDAMMEEIIEAAKKARCHEFVRALPDQYETIVGEGGSTLSGGEKQRISIARAILKDAPIVLLDEATASLDPENELYIQQAIDDLVQYKTVVIIAHRLNTVVGADKIVVLEDGAVVEQGTHQVLMEKEGLYRRMWDEQKKVRQWKF